MIKKKYLILIIVAFLAVIGLILFSKKSSNANSVAVKEVTLSKVVVTRSVSSSGTVVSDDSADLSFATSGRVSYVGVSKGDSVTKGQLLARLDTLTLSDTAQAYKDARDIALRNRDLFIEQYEGDHPAAGGDDQYAIKLRTHDELVSQAEATYASSTSGLRNSYIYSPFSGTVTDVLTKQGETATAASTVIKIANLDSIKFEISLDQEDIGTVKQDQVARLTLDSFPGHDFKAKVSDIPFFAAADGNFKVKMTVEKETNFPILIGMSGDSYINVASTGSEVNALEFDQVFAENDSRKYVWTLNSDKTIKKLYIEAGLEGDYYTEIKSQITDPIVVPVGTATKVQEGYKAIVAK